MPSRNNRSALRKVWEKVLNGLFLTRFPGSARYWDLRYRLGGTSGAGSYGADRRYKADFLNRLIAEHRIGSVIDFGFGDGSQLHELRIDRYIGFDVSSAAVERCRKIFSQDRSKEFRLVGDYRNEHADAALSLDVLYHLVEDEIFDSYLDRLFHAADRLVVVYATNVEEDRAVRGRHVRHRAFTATVRQRFPEFEMIEAPPRPAELDGSDSGGASFFVFARQAK